MTYEPQQSNGRVDVSVLIPVLNEERHIRESVEAMLSQSFDGEIEYLFMDGASEDRTKAILEEMAAARPPHPRARQPAAADDLRAQHRARERARRLRRAHGRAHPLPGRVRRRRASSGWRAATASSGSPARRSRTATGKWSRRVAIALRSWFGAGGSSKWEAEEEKDIDTGVFTGVWRRATLDEYGGWDDGWPVNQDSELAARFFERGSRIVCMPELGALYTPRDSLEELGKQYWRYGFYRAKTSRYHPASMRRSAVFPPALVLAIAGRRAGAARRCATRAARRSLAWAVGVIAASAPTARKEGPAEGAGLAAVFATMHLSWGAGFLRGCTSFGPPLAALARILGLRRG